MVNNSYCHLFPYDQKNQISELCEVKLGKTRPLLGEFRQF